MYYQHYVPSQNTANRFLRVIKFRFQYNIHIWFLYMTSTLGYTTRYRSLVPLCVIYIRFHYTTSTPVSSCVINTRIHYKMLTASVVQYRHHISLYVYILCSSIKYLYPVSLYFINFSYQYKIFTSRSFICYQH
jgi:hypothetical protein